MKLLQIGNRIINPEKVIHTSYNPTAYHPASTDTWKECVVSFGCDEFDAFYNEEADQVWAYLSASMNCRNITPQRAEIAA